MRLALSLPLLLTLALFLAGQSEEKLYVYVGDVGPRHALIAWGTTQGKGNTIGREAKGQGKAVLQIGGASVETDRAWAQVDGLEPDRTYDYILKLNGRQVAQGQIRTWPERAAKAAFLVIGDWGNASSEQQRIADAMTEVVRQRASTDNPIRFVLSTGDNIYSVIPGVLMSGSGDRDSHWGPRYFQPYEKLLSNVPFYISLGNHDGNESERRGDLALQLDNFFFPRNQPARWYRFQFGQLIDFFALDTTRNTESGPQKDAWAPDGEQFAWAKRELARLDAPWRIVFFHHPMFNAGPRHQKEANELRMKHFLDLFQQAGVQVGFSGHEHNFQMSERNARSRGIRFFVSGAGGELRDGSVTASMSEHNIAAWAPQNHFLVVEVDRNEMKVTPLGFDPIRVQRPDGSPMTMPIVVPREASEGVR